MEVLGITTMNNTRPLFLVCFFLLVGLFTFNSYADEVTIDWKSGTYTGEVSNGVPYGQGTFTKTDGSTYVGECKDDKEWEGTECDKDRTVIATYSEGVETKI